MRTATIVIGIGLSLGLLACGDHYSTQEAYGVCTENQSRNPTGNPPESFADCVACYEDCGSECTPTGTLPTVYDCPD
jgi:hypothetical protein